MNKTWKKVTATIAAILIGGSALTGAAAIPRITATPVEAGTYSLADRMGVTVKRVDGEFLCGIRIVVGCFFSDEPDAIYIVPSDSYTWERFVVHHELMHVIQHREGRPLDECEADAFAEEASPGSTGTYDC